MAALAFHKMHGLGNDFVVVDAREHATTLDPAAIRALADRRRGVGFDQLVWLGYDESAHARVRFFNADGSEAGACGNGIRCAARLIGEGLATTALVLETEGGRLTARQVDGSVWSVAMAVPRFDWRDVPLAEACDTSAVPLGIAGFADPVALSLGNPHAVFFVEDLDGLDIAGTGAPIERHPMFPSRVNVGFAQATGADRLRLKVFERGVGPTEACGSAACAALVAGRRRGLLGERATVVLDGGELEIAWDGEGPVMMTGPTAYVFEGTVDLDELASGGHHG